MVSMCLPLHCLSPCVYYGRGRRGVSPNRERGECELNTDFSKLQRFLQRATLTLCRGSTCYITRAYRFDVPLPKVRRKSSLSIPIYTERICYGSCTNCRRY
ncbi:hypothetical protein J6590_061655 [Homalodisca vitripennis]|nr:hypothetical protein J6590_061655 [Homalodisca vitripennis]